MLKRSSPWDKLCPAEMTESEILKSTPINELPDSLLLDIFEADYYQVSDVARTFPLSALYRSDDEKPTTRSILRVCRRWNAVGTPLLYRRVAVELHKCRLARSAVLLLRTLKSQPQLRLFTREAEILLDSLTTFTEGPVEQLVHLLRLSEASLRSVSIHGHMDAAETRTVLLQLGKSSLENLSCSGFFGGISLSFLLTYFDLSRVKKLRLSRVSNRDHSESREGSNRTPTMTEGIVERHDLSELKELSLCEPYLPAQSLDVLFRQPKSLERLRMTMLMHSTNGATYTVAAIERLLDFQRHSLRYIEFGHMCQVNDELDLTKMTALESLTLNEFTVFQSPAVKAASRLAAPKLKHFAIDFSTEDQREADPMSGMQRITSWLQLFIATRKAVLPDELNMLEEIMLDFHPELQYGVTWESVRQKWQWLEQTRIKLASFGVRLNYPKPITDDEDWHRYLNGSWVPPEIPDFMDESEESDTETDVADMCCRGDMHNSECIASFKEHNHDPAQMRLCRILGFQVNCVH